MSTIYRIYIIVLLCCTGLSAAAQADKKELDISAQCNIYKHNLKDPPENIPGGVGLDPIVVDVRGYKMITFERTTGTINYCPWNDTCLDGTADGSRGVTLMMRHRGMSGITDIDKWGMLLGVFVSNSITPDPFPEDLNFTDKENYTNWGPELQQVFFIGDGVTNKGVIQQILIPSDAETLYLGFADGPVGFASNYSDNKGSIHTTIVLHKTFNLPPAKRVIKN